MTASLYARTATGMRWMLINTVGERVLSFGTTMVLARILDPQHFGLYALAFIAIDSLGIFKNLGLDAAIIQRKDRVEEAADTVFMVLPLLGLTLCGLLYLAAPTVAVWLGNPEVGRPIQALGLVLILMSIGNVPASLVQKSMRFDIRAAANLTGMAAYAGLAITLALRGWGVWSLVIAYLTRWAVTIPIQWALSGWRPRWRFSAALLKEMLHFSKYVVGAWVIGLLATTTDKIVIGKWLGATQLGYYTLCLGLANFIVAQLSLQVYQVTFPAFAEAQDAPDVLRRGFLKLTKYLLLVSLPVAVLLVLEPRELLMVFYGERWQVAAPVLQVLAIGGALQGLRAGLEPVLMGCGRSRLVFSLNICQLVLLAAGGAVMARAGSMAGVAWVVVAAATVPSLVALRTIMQRTQVSPTELVRSLRPVAVSVLMMVAVISLADLGRSGLGHLAAIPIVWLAAVVPLSSLVYLLGIVWLDRPGIAEFAKLLHLRKPSMARAS